MLLLSQIGFVLLTAVFFGLLIREFKNGISKTSWDANRKKKFLNNIVISLVLWAIAVSVWSYSGMMSDFSKFPFNFLPVIAIPMIALTVFTLSKSAGEVLRNIPQERIIRLQSFRFFVELLLWALFVENLLPVQMTFEGRNFDILVGISAPLIAWLVMRDKISRPFIIAWNLVAIVVLANIVTIAILSTPSPIRVFMNEPANTIVTMFPISWLPAFLVPLAVLLHFFSLRKISVQNTQPAEALKQA